MAITASEARRTLSPLIEQVNDDRGRDHLLTRQRRPDGPRRLRRPAGDRGPAAHAGYAVTFWKAWTRHATVSARRASSRRREGRLHPARLAGHTHWHTADRTIIKRVKRLKRSSTPRRAALRQVTFPDPPQPTLCPPLDKEGSR